MTAISINLLDVLLTKSMLDKLDVEILENRLMSFEHPSSVSFSPFAYLAIAGAVIADGNIGFSGIILLVLSPVVFVGMMELLKDYFLRASLSYINALSKYDSAFRHAISTLRSRETALCRLQSDHYIVVSRCLRPLRYMLLAMLRSDVQNLIALLKRICWDCDSAILLCNVLGHEISDLALTDDVQNKFLELSSLRELRQVYHLLRSEFFRYFLLHLSQPSYKVVLLMFTVIRKTAEIKDKKMRLLSELKNLSREADRLVDNRHSVKIETVQAYLSFAAEVLSENELRNELKFRRVVTILQETCQLLTNTSPSESGEENESGGTVAEVAESMGNYQKKVFKPVLSPIASEEEVSREPTPPEESEGTSDYSDYQQEESNDESWGNRKRSSADENGTASIANVPANDNSAQSQFARTMGRVYAPHESYPSFIHYDPS